MGLGRVSIRILVVEDDRDSREALVELLSGCGAEVSVARSGREGFLLYKRFLFHAVVSDIAMPEGNGFSLMRRIRNSEMQVGRAPTFAVAVTASGTPEARERALEAGFDEFLRKPVEVERLLTLLTSRLDRPFKGYAKRHS